jgi:hypothetical protein
MPEGAIALDDVIAPLSRERFVREYWTKSHLLLKGAKGRFTPLLTWDDLNEILEQHKPSPSAIRLFQEGRPIDPRLYIDGEGGQARLNAGGLVASLSQGASLVMDGIHERDPCVGILASAFQDLFEAPVYVNLYASWGRTNCFTLHWDPQEVFILQLSGRKHWKVYAPTRAFPLKDDPDKAAEPAGPPVWEGILEDGDMLYMPRGWWHMATPLDEPSLHLNFGLEPPNGADFLRWWFPRLLRRADMRQNLPLGGDAAVRQTYFAGLLNSMSADGQGRDLAGEFLREWNAYRRARPVVRLPLAPGAQKIPLGMATAVRLAQRDGLFTECEPGERTARFQVAGRSYNIWPQLVPALQRLSSRQSITVGELCGGIGDQQVVTALITALETLARDGVILKEAPQVT